MYQGTIDTLSHISAYLECSLQVILLREQQLMIEEGQHEAAVNT